MKETELIDHLMELARRLGFEVRTEPGPFRDGACRLSLPEGEAADRRMIILNRHSSTHAKVLALGRALSQCSLEDVYLVPAVREAIEQVPEHSVKTLRRTQSL